MPLIDSVRLLLAQLDASGWDAVLAPHGLRLGALLASPDLVSALKLPLQPDRSRIGFKDFALNGTQAIQPGEPYRSLLFHALASPQVLLPGPGSNSEDCYPTLEQLDTLENFIYSLAGPFEEGALDEFVVAVFAYEYRAASATTHRRHADFVYSRTGVARLGEAPANYHRRLRCFVRNPAQPDRFAVAPSRYGAFLARKVQGVDQLSLMGQPQDGDDQRTFLLPVHKLFSGDECIPGRTIQISFTEYHRSEKLRRAVEIGGLKVDTQVFDLDRAPFVRESKDGELVELSLVGAGCLISPPAQPLVRRAVQAVHGDPRKPVTFEVPPRGIGIPGTDLYVNRHGKSSYMILGGYWTFIEEVAETLIHRLLNERPPKVRPRQAPEFVNIRVVLDADGREVFLNQIPGDDYLDKLNEGNYQALFFEDGTCDGCVVAVVDEALASLPQYAAFSLISPPDFFPSASEMDIEAWVDEHPSHNYLDQFKEGSPDPLCRGRYSANPGIHWPGNSSRPAFQASDQTLVAIVGRHYGRTTGPTWNRKDDRAATYLTDAASNEFAPGWDVTYSGEQGAPFYATYGLGSPFVEDAKFCAAANAYWPAAAPDASRTFHNQSAPTAIPLLDAELGYHSMHPLVLNGPQAETWGWDGEQGPYFTTIDNQHVVNFASMERSDYVRNALEGKLARSTVLDGVDSTELTRRMDCLRICIQVLPRPGDEIAGARDKIGMRPMRKVNATQFWLVSAVAVDDLSTADARLAGPGYRYEFALPDSGARPQPDPNDFRRAIIPAGDTYLCYVSPSSIVWKKQGGEFQFLNIAG